MYCPSCGEEIADGSGFCRHCGDQLESGNPTAPTTDEAGTGSGGATAGTVDTEPGTVVGGLDRNVAGALTYVLGFITGLVFYLIEEEDEFVRYHAAQSMVVFGGLFVLSIAVNVFNVFLSAAGGIFVVLIGFVFSVLWFVVSLGAIVLWLFLIIKAYQGERPRIPIAAGIADDLV